jgi:hypothetical protein
MRRPLIAVIVTALVAGAAASDADDAAAEVGRFLTPPQLAGWKAEARGREYSLPRVSPFHLQSADGQVDVDIGIHVLARGRQGKDHVGAILASEWLPKNKRWLPVGPGDRQCFRHESLSTTGGEPRVFSGQVRCRHTNVVLVFNMFSRLDRRRSDATWKGAFARIVEGTKTAARCLDPEAMTYLVDSEGPPFGTRAVDSDTMIVAPTPLCGSDGCTCYRYEHKQGCFELVLPQYHCDELLRRMPPYVARRGVGRGR